MSRGGFLVAAVLSERLLLAFQPTATRNGIEAGIELYWSGDYEKTISTLAPLCASGAPEDAVAECFKYLAFGHVALGDAEAARGAFAELLRPDAEHALDETQVSPKILEPFRAARTQHVESLFEEGKAAYFGKEYPEAKDLMDGSSGSTRSIGSRRSTPTSPQSNRRSARGRPPSRSA